MSAMQLTVRQEPLHGRQLKLEIDIPFKELDSEYNKIKDEWVREIAVPGFRKGKVPPAFVEKRFRPSIQGQVIQNLLPKAYEQAVKDQSLQPYGQAVAEKVSDFENDKPVTVEFRVSLMPTCEVSDIKGVQVKKKKTQVTDADIEKEVKSHLRSRAELKEDTGPITDDSFVRLDVVFQDEALKSESVNNYPVSVEYISDDSSLLTRKELEKLKLGEAVEIKKKYDDKFPNPALAGKAATLSVTLKEIKKIHLPEITDELAKELGFESVAGMRESIKTRIDRLVEQHTELDIRKQVLEFLKPKAKIEVSHAMVHDTAHYLMDRYLSRFGQGDEAVKNFVRYTGKSMEELHKDYHAVAEKEIAEELIVEELIKQFKIEISEERMDQEIEKHAARTKQDAKAMRKEMLKSGEFTRLKRQLAENEAIQKVVESGKVKEGDTVTLDELLKG